MMMMMSIISRDFSVEWPIMPVRRFLSNYFDLLLLVSIQSFICLGVFNFGVINTCDLKSARQCTEAAKKATTVLRLVKRHFHDINIPTFRILYKTFVRPHLEYCVQAWSPHLRKDINTLERIQMRATKLVPELRHLTYYERLYRLDLTTLEEETTRGPNRNI